MLHPIGRSGGCRGGSSILVIALLLILGLVFVVAEAFLPGGVVGIVGGAILIASAVICFSEYGVIAGSVYLACSIVLTTAVGLTAFLMVVKRIALKPPEPVGPTGDERIGAEARAMTDLDPTGFVELEGKRSQARSESSEKAIPRDATVVVVDTDSTYLIVRPL